MTELLATGFDDYAYLDSGDGARLERFGPHILNRPAPSAVWPPARPRALWDGAAATFTRTPDGGGTWSFNRTLPPEWTVRVPLAAASVTPSRNIALQLQATASGQVGLFPEQQPNWNWVADWIAARPAPVRLLNLFSYTGAMSLAAAAAGAHVTHVDAVRGVVRWASDNATLSGLGGHPIRWIVDDVLRFVKRDVRRAAQYDAIVLDPPSFGRGAQGQVFKFERDLGPLLEACVSLLAPGPAVLLLTCHTPGITRRSLDNALAPLARAAGATVTTHDVLLTGPTAPLPLPCGTSARFQR